MATLREVRQRIAGVKSTQKITKAMKMVATAKLRRAQQGVVSARPYARTMKKLLEHLLGAAEGPAAEFIRPREVRNVALVVVTADRGLCGSFNTNLAKAAVQHIEEAYPGWRSDGRVTLYCIGRRGADYFARRGYTIAQRFLNLFQRLAFADSQRIARLLMDDYRAGKVDRVVLVYNEFKSISQQRIVVEQFLPVPPAAASADPHATVEYIYEPSQQEILRDLAPRYLQFQLWRVLLESNAAEQGARMSAMDNATENAREMIDALQLQYNKARQASITKELLEVVGGAEALASSR